MELAERDFEVAVERATMSLRGIRNCLEAWSVFERDGTPAPNYRDDALMFLGTTAVDIGESVEVERIKFLMARQAAIKKRAG